MASPKSGKTNAVEAINSMRPERSTNLMAGITTGALPTSTPNPRCIVYSMGNPAAEQGRL